MAAPAEAYVVHASPGRLRLRVPSRRGDAGYFDGVTRRLRDSGGWSRVEANPLTGSVLISDERVRPGAVAEAAVGAGLFQLRGRGAEGGSLMEAVGAGIDAAEQRLVRGTAGRLDLSAAAFVALVAAGAIQLARGRTMPPAVTLLWYAATIAQGAAAHRRFQSMFASGDEA